MKGSEFVFDYAYLLYYKSYKINPNLGGLYIHSPYLINNKKATINPMNKKDKCFQDAGKVELNHEEIAKNPKRITKIKPFINKCKWKGIIFPSEKDD